MRFCHMVNLVRSEKGERTLTREDLLAMGDFEVTATGGPAEYGITARPKGFEKEPVEFEILVLGNAKAPADRVQMVPDQGEAKWSVEREKDDAYTLVLHVRRRDTGRCYRVMIAPGLAVDEEEEIEEPSDTALEIRVGVRIDAQARREGFGGVRSSDPLTGWESCNVQETFRSQVTPDMTSPYLLWDGNRFTAQRVYDSASGTASVRCDGEIDLAQDVLIWLEIRSESKSHTGHEEERTWTVRLENVPLTRSPSGHTDSVMLGFETRDMMVARHYNTLVEMHSKSIVRTSETAGYWNIIEGRWTLDMPDTHRHEFWILRVRFRLPLR